MALEHRVRHVVMLTNNQEQVGHIVNSNGKEKGYKRAYKGRAECIAKYPRVE